MAYNSTNRDYEYYVGGGEDSKEYRDDTTTLHLAPESDRLTKMIQVPTSHVTLFLTLAILASLILNVLLLTLAFRGKVLRLIKWKGTNGKGYIEEGEEWGGSSALELAPLNPPQFHIEGGNPPEPEPDPEPEPEPSNVQLIPKSLHVTDPRSFHSETRQRPTTNQESRAMFNTL